MTTATFEFFIKVQRMMAELAVAKTQQEEKQRIGRMSPTARLVEELRETLVPKCPGTPFAQLRPLLD
jgi:hypothetical protein